MVIDSAASEFKTSNDTAMVQGGFRGVEVVDWVPSHSLFRETNENEKYEEDRVQSQFSNCNIWGRSPIPMD